jgi:hypothetical protein
MGVEQGGKQQSLSFGIKHTLLQPSNEPEQKKRAEGQGSIPTICATVQFPSVKGV